MPAGAEGSALASVIQFFTGNAIVALMLAAGLQTTNSVLADLSRRWKLASKALAVVWIAIPSIAILVVRLLHVPRAGTAALLVMAICAGVPLVVKTSRRAHGAADTTLMVLLATALTAPIMIPVWSAILTRVTPIALHASPTEVLGVLVPTVVIPFLIGRIIQRISQRAAGVLARVANVMFIVGLALLLAVLIYRGVPILSQTTLRAVIAVVIVTLAAAGLGYLAGRPRASDQISLAYAAALGNPALALVIAAHGVPGARAAPMIAAYVVVRTLALLPFGIWLAWRSRRRSTPLSHDPDLAPAHGH